MLVRKTIGYCLASLLCALPAAAQTGRIAHFSHSGSGATLAAAEAKDNFGVPPTEYQSVKISPLSDTTVLVEGQERFVGAQQWRSFKANFQIATRSKQASELRYYRSSEGYTVDIWSLDVLQQLYPGAELLGFGKAKPPVPLRRTSKPAPKKTSGRTQVFPSGPFQHSYWRNFAGVAALGVVGWLLSKKRVA